MGRDHFIGETQAVIEYSCQVRRNGENKLNIGEKKKRDETKSTGENALRKLGKRAKSFRSKRFLMRRRANEQRAKGGVSKYPDKTLTRSTRHECITRC